MTVLGLQTGSGPTKRRRWAPWKTITCQTLVRPLGSSSVAYILCLVHKSDTGGGHCIAKVNSFTFRLNFATKKKNDCASKKSPLWLFHTGTKRRKAMIFLENPTCCLCVPFGVPDISHFTCCVFPLWNGSKLVCPSPQTSNLTSVQQIYFLFTVFVGVDPGFQTAGGGGVEAQGSYLEGCLGKRHSGPGLPQDPTQAWFHLCFWACASSVLQKQTFHCESLSKRKQSWFSKPSFENRKNSQNSSP